MKLNFNPRSVGLSLFLLYGRFQDVLIVDFFAAYQVLVGLFVNFYVLVSLVLGSLVQVNPIFQKKGGIILSDGKGYINKCIYIHSFFFIKNKNNIRVMTIGYFNTIALKCGINFLSSWVLGRVEIHRIRSPKIILFVLR